MDIAIIGKDHQYSGSRVDKFANLVEQIPEILKVFATIPGIFRDRSGLLVKIGRLNDDNVEGMSRNFRK